MLKRYIKKILAPIVREILKDEAKKNSSQEVQEILLKALKNSSNASL